jgi:hypothetical protein
VSSPAIKDWIAKTNWTHCPICGNELYVQNDIAKWCTKGITNDSNSEFFPKIKDIGCLAISNIGLINGGMKPYIYIYGDYANEDAGMLSLVQYVHNQDRAIEFDCGNDELDKVFQKEFDPIDDNYYFDLTPELLKALHEKLKKINLRIPTLKAFI